MLKNIKIIIAQSARSAVEEAEKLFGSKMGAAKKEAAVNFVIEAMPVPFFIKPLAKALLSKAIDEAVEHAVCKLQKATNTALNGISQLN